VRNAVLEAGDGRERGDHVAHRAKTYHQDARSVHAAPSPPCRRDTCWMKRSVMPESSAPVDGEPELFKTT